MSSITSRSRKSKASGGDGATTSKKAKTDEEENKLWIAFEDIPPDLNQEQRRQLMDKLSESLVEAAKTGNCEFVHKVLTTKQTCDLLTFQKHVPQRNYSDARAHLLQIYGQEPPAQPYFGLRDLIWLRGRQPQTKNLLIEAIRGNQLEMVKELSKRGLDINASHAYGYRMEQTTNPLLRAIEEGHREIIHFLLERPRIILTHPETRVFPRGNGRSRPRCEPTALSMATEMGMLDVVQLLIEKGALLPSSTSRSNDPYSLQEEDSHKAKELVRFSIKEAIIEAHKKAGQDDRHVMRNVPVQVHADILELLLSKTGAQEDNAISVYILDKIHRDKWEDNTSTCSPSYHYILYDDRDFDCVTGAPSARPMAVLRGLRTVHPDSLRGVIDMSESDIDRVKEKHEQWSRLVKVCQERLAAAGPDWRNAVDEAIAARREGIANPRLDGVEGALRKTQLLLWCQLFATPWSRDRHLDYYPGTTRRFVKELLHIGSFLDRKLGQAGALKEVWDREIMSLSLSSKIAIIFPYHVLAPVVTSDR